MNPPGLSLIDIPSVSRILPIINRDSYQPNLRQPLQMNRNTHLLNPCWHGKIELHIITASAIYFKLVAR
jgi:hypothetical protein